MSLFDGELFCPHGPWRAVCDVPDHGVGLATQLFAEADLLDEWCLDDWLAMYAAECVYWVPIRYNAPRPDTHVNLIFDNRSLLEDRVYRLQTGKVPSQDPPSRTVRALTSLMVADSGDASEFLVRSTFSLHEHRPRNTRLYVGRYTHRLRHADTGWQIVGKKVTLLTSDEPLPSLTFLL